MSIIKNQKGQNIIGQGGKIILFTLPFLILMISIHLFLPKMASLPESINFIKPFSYVLFLFGFLLWVTGVIQLLIEFSKGILITYGAYNIVRNPIYSSFCFFILPAISIITLTWVYFAVSFFMYIGVNILIKKEEEQLKRIFGKEYEEYCLSVDRMIPLNFVKAGKNNQNQATKYFLIFGIMAVIIFIFSDVVCALSDSAYNYFDLTVSELSAIGAPTRTMWLTLTFLFSPLIIACGIGIFRVPGKILSLKITGVLVVLWGISLNVWPFFPMNMRGNISGNTSETGHLILAGFTVLLFIALLIIGSVSQGIRFRIYSFTSLGVMMISGIKTGSMASLVAENKPTPFMGIYERISEFLPMIWLVILAVILLKKMKSKTELEKNIK